MTAVLRLPGHHPHEGGLAYLFLVFWSMQAPAVAGCSQAQAAADSCCALQPARLLWLECLCRRPPWGMWGGSMWMPTWGRGWSSGESLHAAGHHISTWGLPCGCNSHQWACKGLGSAYLAVQQGCLRDRMRHRPCQQHASHRLQVAMQLLPSAEN